MEDTTWTSEASPYVLAGIVTVERDATLTIEAGAVVQGSSGATLSVRGVLHVQGSEQEPVIFTSESGQRDWQGIRLDWEPEYLYERPPTSTLQNIHASQAAVALFLDQRLAVIENSTFEGNGTAIVSENLPGTLEIARNVFTDNDMAIRGRTRTTIHVTQNDFWNNHVNLLMQPQRRYDCYADAGLWDVHRNDILLGPRNRNSPIFPEIPEGSAYRPHDVRTPTGSYSSGYSVSATDNWWGTTQPHEITFRVEDLTCCPRDSGKKIHWDPPSESSNTEWEPEGEVLTAYSDGSHTDPSYWATVEQPVHGRCFRRGLFEVMYGSAHGALGRAYPPDLGLRRVTASGCLWWRHENQRLVERSCEKPLQFAPTDTRRRSGIVEWEYRLARHLPKGRYTAFAYDGSGTPTPGRNKVSFRLL